MNKLLRIIKDYKMKLHPFYFLVFLSMSYSTACQQNAQEKKEEIIKTTVSVDQYQEVSVEWVMEALEASSPKFTVLDVRTQAEADQGTIPGAIVVDVKKANFETELDNPLSQNYHRPQYDQIVRGFAPLLACC